MWIYHTMGQNTLRNEQIAINTVQDDELSKKIKDALDVHTGIVNDMKEFLIKEGVPLPKPTAGKPIGDYQSIPDGAKLTDEEVANLLSFNLVLAMTYGIRGLTESLRSDVGLMYFKFLTKHLTVALPLKQLMVKRDWIQ